MVHYTGVTCIPYAEVLAMTTCMLARFKKLTCQYKEVNRTDPSRLVKFPWIKYHCFYCNGSPWQFVFFIILIFSKRQVQNIQKGYFDHTHLVQFNSMEGPFKQIGAGVGACQQAMETHNTFERNLNKNFVQTLLQFCSKFSQSRFSKPVCYKTLYACNC